MATCGMKSSCGKKQLSQGQYVELNGYFTDLYDYKQCHPTQSCYLDGRYFNKVFCKYPGLIKEPLCIYLGSGGFDATMPHIKINTNYQGLLRVVIETDVAKHSTLVILDHAKRNAYWFEPFSSPFDIMIQSIIEKYVGYQVIRVPHRAANVTSQGCDISGFCNAYVIKYAYDYLNKRTIDLTMIKSFASRIEEEYVLAEGEPDITYGWLDDPRNKALLIGAGLGAGTGLLLGGGAAGLLGGAALGGIGGYTLGSLGTGRSLF